MKPTLTLIPNHLILAALSLSLALTAFAQGTKPAAATLSAERSLLVTVTAKVEAIDPAKREVKLKGPLGNIVTFVVSLRAKPASSLRVKTTHL